MNPDREDALFRVAYRHLRSQHKKRWGPELPIDYETFTSLATKPCTYCGHVGSNKIKDVQRGKVISDTVLRTNGIDRIDNHLGYTLANSTTACRFCNSAKSIMSVDYFKAWVKQVYKHLDLSE